MKLDAVLATQITGGLEELGRLTIIPLRPRRVVVGQDDGSMLGCRRRGYSNLDVAALRVRGSAKQQRVRVEGRLQGALERFCFVVALVADQSQPF